MKYNDELNYYELLEIPVDASFFEIRHAYKGVLAIYEEDSASTYTLFSKDEREEILGKLEQAFNTLLDEKKRAAYDQELVDSGKVDKSAMSAKREKTPIPIFQAVKSDRKNHLLNKIKESIKNPGTKSLIEKFNLQKSISGKDLKALRESIGIELHEIFEVSRISIATLEAIEADRIVDLPSKIYLKGFLRSYADLFLLDLDKLVNHFMINTSDSG